MKSEIDERAANVKGAGGEEGGRCEGHPWVMVVGAGPFQTALIDAVKAEGARAVVVDGSPVAPGLRKADEAVVCDIRDFEAVEAIARQKGIEAVVSAASDIAAPTVAAVAERLGLWGPSSEVIARCRDKAMSAERVRAAGGSAPETVAVKNLIEAYAVYDAWHRGQGTYQTTCGDGLIDAMRPDDRVVVKPRTGAGGRGVTIVGRREAITAAYKAADHVCHDGVLLQRYVGGRSIGVEAFFVGGEARVFALDDRYREGYVSPTGHLLPAAITAETQGALSEAVSRFGRALGLVDGPANFDLRVEGGRVNLIEVNPRLGGCGISRLVKAAYGVDLQRMLVRMALGRSVDVRPLYERGAATRLVMKYGEGVVKGLEQGLKAAMHMCALGDEIDLQQGNACLGETMGATMGGIEIVAKEGEKVQSRSGDWAILGSVFAEDETAEGAWAKVEAIGKAIEDAITLE